MVSECRDRTCFACAEGGGCCRCDATVLDMSERVASLETAVACERRLKERAQAERDAALAVVSEAVVLCRSGYDGPMMGPAIAALMEAVARWESLR